MRLALLLALGLAAASCAPAPRHGSGGPPPGPGKGRVNAIANPSALIAIEIAFNKLAQQEGQWAAFREYAADDAVMFAPQPVNAQQWLKDRPEPAARLAWQPHQVWMSCDGSLGVTKGAWQRTDGKVGYFTTIWRRQDKGEYKWVLDQGDTLGMAMPEPDMLSAKVADCEAGAPKTSPEAPVVTGSTGEGRSRDGSLAYRYAVEPSGGRMLAVSIWRDGEMHDVLTSRVSGSGE